MLGTINPDGLTLKYKFVETLNDIQIFFIARSFGGALYLLGFLLCAYNIWKTARSGAAFDETVEVTVLEKKQKDGMTWGESLLSDPLTHIALAMAFVILFFFLPPHANKAALLVAVLLSIKACIAFKASKNTWVDWHERIVENYLPFTVLVFAAVAIGGAVQIIPSLIVNRDKNIEGRLQELYTPLELAGRDIYISEGCYLCHSQMIRTLKPDVMRYGRPGIADDYSHLGESLYDHPYQWGSKRTGPDLAREGGPLAKDPKGNPYKYMRVGPSRGNSWHFSHFQDPRGISPGSNMPAFPWLFEKETEVNLLPHKIAVQRKLGVPWPALDTNEITAMAESQAQEIAGSLVDAKVSLPGKPDLQGDALRNQLAKTQVVAVIAYLQKLGTYREIKKDHPAEPSALDPDSQRKASIGK